MAGEGVQLPRWASKFTLSAQKPSLAPLLLDENEHGGAANAAAGGLLSPKPAFRAGTPLGGARRVPLAAAGAANAAAVKSSLATTAARSKARHMNEPETATPLACLFDRFDALAIDTSGPKAARPATMRLPAPGPVPLAVAGAQPVRVLAAAAPCSPLGPARRVAAPASSARGAGAARVTFGVKPLLHHYDAATRTAGAAASPQLSASFAGRTPYSLAAASRHVGSGGGLCSGTQGHSAGLAVVSPLGALDFGLADVQEAGEEAASDSGVADGSTASLDDQHAGVTPGRGGTSFAFAAAATAQASPSCSPSTAADVVTPVLLLGGAGACPVNSIRQGDVEAGARGCGREQETVVNALPFAVPTPVPKLALRTPARVASQATRPHACAELRALTQDSSVAAAAAAAVVEDFGACAHVPHGLTQPALGSIARLSPVRASKKVVGSLGAEAGQVLTPVRRSARKAVHNGSSLQPPSAATAAADVARKLEATRFCYEGNPGLTSGHVSRPPTKE